jgi:hypothetical protein
MIKILVTNKLSGQVQESLMPDMAAANAWIAECELKEAWGKPFHIVNYPEQITPQEPLVIHHEESVDTNNEIVPAWDELIPQPDIIIPAWTEEIQAEYTVEIVDITAEVNAKELQRKYDYLWKAANDFQSGQISGAAIGLLTIGVLMSKPKCADVQAWIKTVWVEYYTRKAMLTLESELNLDFSVCGMIPFTVPELMEEVSI